MSYDHVAAEEHVFRDEGYGGGRLDRSGPDALRDSIRDGALGIVAVPTSDRLARRYACQVSRPPIAGLSDGDGMTACRMVRGSSRTAPKFVL